MTQRDLTQRVLIIAVGDHQQDGAGRLAPALLAELKTRPVAESWWLTLVSDSEFEIDHVLELQNSDLALFVDCSRDGRAPFVFREIEIEESQRAIVLNETLAPSGVMHTLATIGRRESLPPAFELSLQAQKFSGQEGLSANATSSLATAVAFVEQLLTEPSADSWRREVNGPPRED